MVFWLKLCGFLFIDIPKKLTTDCPGTPEITSRIRTFYVDARWLYDSVETGKRADPADYQLSSFDGEPASPRVSLQLSNSSVIELDTTAEPKSN